MHNLSFLQHTENSTKVQYELIKCCFQNYLSCPSHNMTHETLLSFSNPLCTFTGRHISYLPVEETVPQGQLIDVWDMFIERKMIDGDDLKEPR